MLVKVLRHITKYRKSQSIAITIDCDLIFISYIYYAKIYICYMNIPGECIYHFVFSIIKIHQLLLCYQYENASYTYHEARKTHSYYQY